jgi:hypothetical protein
VAAFLVGEALSAIGSWATIIAVWVYAAYQYDASAGDVALFGLAFVLPGIVLGRWPAWSSTASGPGPPWPRPRWSASPPRWRC